MLHKLINWLIHRSSDSTNLYSQVEDTVKAYKDELSYIHAAASNREQSLNAVLLQVGQELTILRSTRNEITLLQEKL